MEFGNRYMLFQVRSFGTYALASDRFASPEEALSYYEKEGWKANTDNNPVVIGQIICAVNVVRPPQTPVATLEPLSLPPPSGALPASPPQPPAPVSDEIPF